MSKRALLIAYYYPPNPSSGSNRALGLSKYLPYYGWDVTVVTTAYPGRKCEDFDWSVIEAPDPGSPLGSFRRLNKIFITALHKPDRGKTTSSKIGRFGFNRWMYDCLCFPDEQIRWYLPCINTCKSISRASPFDVVITTSPPVTSHLIGRKLKKIGVAKRWVADFRDLWTQNHYRLDYHTKLRNLAERLLERSTLGEADLIITVSTPMAESLSNLHPRARVETITNGFDVATSSSLLSPSFGNSKKFTIVHTGSLYSGRRNPDVLFSAIRSMLADGTLSPFEYEVLFLGDDSPWLREKIKRHTLENNVVVAGVHPHEQIIGIQRAATALLLLRWDHPSEVGTIPGKLYEYLAAGRPILSSGGPGGAVSEILRKTRAGFHVQSEDGVRDILSTWLKEFRETGKLQFRGKMEEISAFSWPKLALSYSNLLNDL